MFTLFFAAGAVRNLTDALRSDTARFARYFQEMLQRRIYLPCSQFEANFVSAAHTPEDIERTVAAAAESLAAIREV
jgi:glutamate-1-semialdehyde 2,1-aminomutase